MSELMTREAFNVAESDGGEAAAMSLSEMGGEVVVKSAQLKSMQMADDSSIEFEPDLDLEPETSDVATNFASFSLPEGSPVLGGAPSVPLAHPIIPAPTVPVPPHALALSLEGSKLHPMTAADSDAWLLQHSMLARRQVMTPRLLARMTTPPTGSTPGSRPQSKKGKGGGSAKPSSAKGGKKKKQKNVRKAPTVKDTPDSFMSRLLPSYSTTGKSLLRLQEEEVS